MFFYILLLLALTTNSECIPEATIADYTTNMCLDTKCADADLSDIDNNCYENCKCDVKKCVCDCPSCSKDEGDECECEKIRCTNDGTCVVKNKNPKLNAFLIIAGSIVAVYLTIFFIYSCSKMQQTTSKRNLESLLQISLPIIDLTEEDKNQILEILIKGFNTKELSISLDDCYIYNGEKRLEYRLIYVNYMDSIKYWNAKGRHFAIENVKKYFEINRELNFRPQFKLHVQNRLPQSIFTANLNIRNNESFETKRVQEMKRELRKVMGYDIISHVKIDKILENNLTKLILYNLTDKSSFHKHYNINQEAMKEKLAGIGISNLKATSEYCVTVRFYASNKSYKTKFVIETLYQCLNNLMIPTLQPVDTEIILLSREMGHFTFKIKIRSTDTRFSELREMLTSMEFWNQLNDSNKLPGKIKLFDTNLMLEFIVRTEVDVDHTYAKKLGEITCKLMAEKIILPLDYTEDQELPNTKNWITIEKDNSEPESVKLQKVEWKLHGKEMTSIYLFMSLSGLLVSEKSALHHLDDYIFQLTAEFKAFDLGFKKLQNIHLVTKDCWESIIGVMEKNIEMVQIESMNIETTLT